MNSVWVTPEIEAERLDHMCCIAEKTEGVGRFPVERACAEDASLMHGLHGWLAVFVGGAEEHPCRSR